MHALPNLAHQFERQLLDRGIAKIELVGLEQQEIAIELGIEDLRAMSLSLNQLGQHIAASSSGLPAGNINKDYISQQFGWVILPTFSVAHVINRYTLVIRDILL